MDLNSIATPDRPANSEPDHQDPRACGPILTGLDGFAVNGADPDLCDLAALAGLDPDVPGVRLNARWRRDSAGGEQLALPWSWLEDRRGYQEIHRGREWSPGDLELADHIGAQTWNVADVGARTVRLPVWMLAAFVCPRTGDAIEIPTNPRARMMIGVVWAAFVAGSGGVMLTRAQWAQLLGCSPRSVYTYQCELLRRGLLRRVETWKPARDEFGGRIAGSTHGALLLRIGPMLDALAPLAFEAGGHGGTPPRRGLFTRRQASQLAGRVRKRARAEARLGEGHHHRKQAHWSGRTAREGSNTPRWSSSTPRPGHRRPVSKAAAIVPRQPTAAPAGPEPAPSPVPGSAVERGTAPPHDARALSTWQNLPTTPPPPFGGSLAEDASAPPVRAPDPKLQDLAPLVTSSRAVPRSTAEPGTGDGAGSGPAGADAPPDEPDEYGPKAGNPRADARRELERITGGTGIDWSDPESLKRTLKREFGDRRRSRGDW